MPSLARNQSLTELDLSSCGLSDQSAEKLELIEVIHSRTFLSLFFHYDYQFPMVAGACLELLRLISTFILMHACVCACQSQSRPSFTDGPRVGLRILDLSDNGIGDDGAVRLALSLRHSPVMTSARSCLLSA